MKDIKKTDRWPFLLFGFFLVIASVIAALAAITVLFPYGSLVIIWSFKKAAFQQLLKVQILSIVGFSVLSILLAMAAVGWFQQRKWAWVLSLLILLMNFFLDITRMLVTSEWIDAAGVIFEGFILLWLVTRSVRNLFTGSDQ